MTKQTHGMVHHSVTVTTTTVAEIDRMHRARGYAQIGYHFWVFVGGDGRWHVRHGRPLTLAGAHAGVARWNRDAIGICIAGCYHPGFTISRRLSESDYAQVLAILLHVLATYRIPPTHVLRHRDVRATACPGDWFPWARLATDLRARLRAK